MSISGTFNTSNLTISGTFSFSEPGSWSASRAEALPIPDTDGDGVGHEAYPDNDNDGIPDGSDLFPVGRFKDVPPGYLAVTFVERLADSGITAGYGNDSYCPLSAVTRAQMAVFLVRTFGL